MELIEYFDRVILLNLRQRPDRQTNVQEALRQCRWPFKPPEVFEAVDGHLFPRPASFTQGPGAWGCLNSHKQILERAIADKVRNILILEDDICFVEDFPARVAEFLRDVPDDWDQLMFGGQHMLWNGLPEMIRPGIYRCTGCERTHGYAVRGPYMARLVERWTGGGMFNGNGHCDWIMGRDPDLQPKHNVYAPCHFLIGQERTKSDINHRVTPRQFWNPPGMELKVINLHAPKPVVAALREYGFHTGYDRDKLSDWDNGLIKVFEEVKVEPTEKAQQDCPPEAAPMVTRDSTKVGRGSLPAVASCEGRVPAEPTPTGAPGRAEQDSAPTRSDAAKREWALRQWINVIQWEVASDPRLICTVWHPQADAALVRKASLWPVIEITANTVDEALRQLPRDLRRPRMPDLLVEHRFPTGHRFQRPQVGAPQVGTPLRGVRSGPPQVPAANNQRGGPSGPALPLPSSRPPTPTKSDLTKNFGKAMLGWAKAGFTTVKRKVYEQRHAICNACQHWVPDARLGTGMCRKCGCSGVKLWLATSACPDQPPRW